MTFITKGQFRAWMDAQPDGAKPCSGDLRCPLAVAGGYEMVGIGEYLPPGSSDLKRLPEWAWHFLDEVDRAHGGEWKQMTIAEIRGALLASELEPTGAS